MLNPTTLEEMTSLIDWIREFVDSTGAKGVVLGASGGADSSCVMGLLTRAIGADRALAVTMGIESSDHALTDAHLAAQWCGVRIIDRSLERTFATFLEEAQLDGDEAFEALSAKRKAILRGNVKARLRTTMVRCWAEANGYLFVNTCNWSETIVGYDTKGGGDADGDFSPLMQFVKGCVWSMLRMMNAPQQIIDKAPSADLEEGQTDEDDLQMSYAVLDAFAAAFAAGGRQAVLEMDDPEGKRGRFLHLMDGSRHKRAPMPTFQREGFVHDGT